MTEVLYNAYVNAMREKQKSQKPKFHYDLAEEFEQKAKINEVNENSSEDNNYGVGIDDEVQDHDDSNELNIQPSQTNKEDSPTNPFNFIAKPQPQVPNYNSNNKPTNTYQHFGYSQPPSGNQFLNQK